MPVTIAGHVLDSNRRPVGKARVSFKGKEVAESRSDGFFSVTLEKPESRLALTFASEGYVSNTRVYGPRAGLGQVVVMWPIGYRVKFDPSRELDIELGSSRLQIPAKALTGPSGEKLSGPVRLQFTWFDVTNAFQRAAAPGDFSGQLLDGSIRRLNSYGIFDLQILDLKGFSLMLSPSAKVNLAIPVPRRLARRAPKEVGFFDFDTLTGRWIQVGTFSLAPGSLTYNGSVKRLGGQYNLDDPQNTTCVTVRVVNMWDGAPMPDMYVEAQGDQYYSWGWTGANGLVCLLVQRDGYFQVNASGTVNGSFYGTPNPPTLHAPDFCSNEDDCGNPTMCPLVGEVQVDLIVGGGLSALQGVWA